MAYADERVARETMNELASGLERVGFFFRAFSRPKDPESASAKIDSKGYGSGTKMQDAVGVRLTLYFHDDVAIVEKALCAKLKQRFVSTSIDLPKDDTFRPSRLNIVFRLKDDLARQLSLIREFPDKVDSTFELQIRTVFSEGWHEVDHDLRYKRRGDWEGHEDMSRALNGLLATLETCDWSIIQLFDELALRHYRNQNWDALLRTKFRLRFRKTPLSSPLVEQLSADKGLRRSLFRVVRSEYLSAVTESDCALPLTIDNLVYMTNYLFLHSHRITELTPPPVADELAFLSRK